LPSSSPIFTCPSGTTLPTVPGLVSQVVESTIVPVPSVAA